MRQIAIAIVTRNDHVLVGRRPATAVLAGYREFPGGKVEAGELPHAAAERETLEETGLSVRATETLEIVRHNYDHGELELHFVRCELANTQCEPRAPFVWLPCQQLAEADFPPANRTVIARLLK